MHKQSGNAMAEFVVIAAVLVPAFLAMPMLGKLADVNHTTVQVSRYAVWEKTVAGNDKKTDSVISSEVTARFLSAPDSVITSTLKDEYADNVFWQGAGLGNAIIDQEKRISILSQNKDIPGDVGAKYMAKAMDTLGDTLDGAIKNAQWDVESKGFHVVTLNVELEANRLTKNENNCAGQESEDAGGCLSVVGAIFTDEWEAGSAEHVESRVRSMVPAGVAETITDAISIVGYVPLFKELKYLKDVFGQVQPDVLPVDRYGDQ